MRQSAEADELSGRIEGGDRCHPKNELDDVVAVVYQDPVNAPDDIGAVRRPACGRHHPADVPRPGEKIRTRRVVTIAEALATEVAK